MRCWHAQWLGPSSRISTGMRICLPCTSAGARPAVPVVRSGCAMVVPDFEAIIEIELSAEGFLQAKVLAHKFVELFYMCKELLSKQYHYDFGLRSLKSVLVMAGGLQRQYSAMPEVHAPATVFRARTSAATVEWGATACTIR